MQKHLQKNQKTVRSGFKPFCFLICFTVIIQNTFFLKLQHLKIIYASSIALLRKAGYLIVYNPYAELYHYESKSRGLEDTPEKVARFNKEIATFEKKWPEILKNGDPYYNPNLTLKSQDFSLKRI